MSMVKVTLLTAPGCELCEHAKKVLAGVSADYDIEVFVLSDESAEGSALLVQHLVPFPPGLLLDGKLFSYGRLSERRLRRELERSGASNAGAKVTRSRAGAGRWG
jgi:glutaredoxin